MEKKSSILLIDDEIEILDVLSEVLNSWGFQTFSALNVQEAIEVLDKKNVDIVISDFKMPKENGLVALEYIKNINTRRAVKIPFIFISGESGMTKEEAIRKGADSYFDKPIRLIEFKKLIDDLAKTLNCPT